MSVLEAEIQELNVRSKRLNGEIADKREKLEASIAELREAGKSLATISQAEADLIGEQGKELDTLRHEHAETVRRQQLVMGAHGAAKQAEPASPLSAPHAAASVLAHPDYARYKGNWEGSGPIGNLPAVEVLTRDQAKARFEQGGKLFAAVSDDISGGIALDQRLYPPFEILRRRMRLLDLVTVGATDSNAIVYAQQTVRTATAAETALGVAYNESSFTFAQVTANVRDIGHWTTAYRSNIADAAQFQTIVENQLQEDVLLRIESQILAGTGTGVNLLGIMNTSGVQSVQRDTTNENRMDAVHRAITKVRLAFREPNAILLHPNDYQEAVFTKGAGSGLYLYPEDVRGGPSVQMWGLPVVVSPVATEGTGIVGYWPDATLWMRSGMYLSISDSHSDYFIKRQVAVLAEIRAAFSVGRPAAFCEVLMI